MTEKLSNLLVDVQFALVADAAEAEEPPSSGQLERWAQQAWAHLFASIEQPGLDDHPAEMAIRVVGNEEMLQLNTRFRQQPTTTNVLSFALDDEPAEFLLAASDDAQPRLLGDVVICHPVVIGEAIMHAKPIPDHYAHMVVHGLLHLLGYDHQHDDEAEHMEGLEAAILAGLDISNPYTGELARQS